MIRLPETQVGETVDLGWIDVDAATVRRYWEAVGLPAPERPRQLPLGLALALRGLPRPLVEIAAGAVSVHAGHAVVAHRPFLAGRQYHLTTRIAEVFEKSGRSGPLTVVVRTSELRAASDDVVVAVREQQIARWRAATATPRPVPADAIPAELTPEAAVALDIGATIAVEHRRAPDVRTVHGYAASLSGREPLFSDADFARRLGFADVIVPGPVQSALLEGLLARRLPDWDLADLSLSFRVSVIAGEPITMTALVIEFEEHQRRVVVDLTIENSHGERAAVGTATLRESVAG